MSRKAFSRSGAVFLLLVSLSFPAFARGEAPPDAADRGAIAWLWQALTRILLTAPLKSGPADDPWGAPAPPPPGESATDEEADSGPGMDPWG